jgi:hypothetical protein
MVLETEAVMVLAIEEAATELEMETAMEPEIAQVQVIKVNRNQPPPHLLQFVKHHQGRKAIVPEENVLAVKRIAI